MVYWEDYIMLHTPVVLQLSLLYLYKGLPLVTTQQHR